MPGTATTPQSVSYPPLGKLKGRILRLAHLAPSIVEAILAGRHPPQLTMKDLMKPFPLDWKEQERWFSRTFVESDRYRQK